MNNALELKGLRKAYPEFLLDDINLTLPTGSIMGLIGGETEPAKAQRLNSY